MIHTLVHMLPLKVMQYTRRAVDTSAWTRTHPGNKPCPNELDTTVNMAFREVIKQDGNVCTVMRSVTSPGMYLMPLG